ncbi:peptide deformylase 1B, chloroplastic/mitochondrial-like [Quercus suber]
MSDKVLDSIRTELQVSKHKYEEKTGLASPERIETRQRKKAAAGFEKS